MIDFVIWRRSLTFEKVASVQNGEGRLFLPPVEAMGGLPYELAGLFPNREHNRDLKSLIESLPPNSGGDRISVGLFAADPFLNCEQIAQHLKAKGYLQVSSLPTVASYGAEFLTTLDNVRSGRLREQRTCERLLELGLTVCPALADPESLPQALQLNPPWLWICPSFDMWKDGGIDPGALLILCQKVCAQTDVPAILIPGGSGIGPAEAQGAGAWGLLAD